jgi:Mrp family chromosome partitioning ATPase
MDRLEKALEKCRQQRAVFTPDSGQQNQRASEAGTEAYAFATSPSSEGIDEALLESHRIIAHRTRCPEADVYRQLRTKVLTVMNASGFKALAITSPHYGDGKTTVTVNLGVSIALDLKQTVLLVDADLRKPDLQRVLGIPPHAGLTDYLLKGTPLPECLVRPPFDRVSVLTGGDPLDNSSEVLASPRMISLARELKSRYPDRLVIYDMPPALSQDDPIAFLPQVDAVLVVVRDGITRTEDLKRCLQTLEGANVIGTELNNCW